jgi:heme/copper-type cytochrome/quinol oxidase subunit 3
MNRYQQNRITNQNLVFRHPYHLVNESPWPFTGSFGAFTMVTGGVLYMHNYIGGFLIFITGFLLVAQTMYVWWQDIIEESTMEGKHTVKVQLGLRLGMLLFIVSEIMFFFAFFWAFFCFSLSPVIEIGCVWPPTDFPTLATFHVPLLNTMILVISGVSLTWAHFCLCLGQRWNTICALVYTLILATTFTYFQYTEYCEARFSICDSVYGSTFFMTTGFHGFHVMIGTVFLFVALQRVKKFHFTPQHHFGFEAAAWYWHFVDIVWLFLFLSMYWWGGYPVFTYLGMEL